MKEYWCAIPGYETRYAVSSFGRVRSLGARARVLRLAINSDGYPCVHLPKRRVVPVHRLVLLAFVGPCPRGKEARHFPDRTKTNNRLENLSWATTYVNQRDRDKHGTHNKGTNNKWAKLDARKVKIIRQVKHWPYGSLTVMAKRFGVTRTVIGYVRDRKSWRHL